VFIYLSLGCAYTEDFTLWIDAQNCFEKALQLSKNSDYIYENVSISLSYARLLNYMQDYGNSIKVLNQCDVKGIKNKIFALSYHKLKYDALSGLGDLIGAEKENEKITTLNYENDINLKFLTLLNKAKKNIRDGNQIRSYYYLFRLNKLIQKEFTNDKQRLFAYYSLEYIYNLRFGSLSDVKIWNEKARAICDKNSPGYFDFLRAEAFVAKFENKKEYFKKSTEIFNLTKKDITNHFKYLTENQRNLYWSKYENIIPILYEASYYDTKSTIRGGICYDAALFSKGIILSSSIEFAKLLAASKNKEALNGYYHLLYIKEQINALNSKSERFDSLNYVAEKLERKLIQQSKPFGDYTQRMVIKWQDVQSKLKPNEVAIEFIDFSIEKDTIYAALILKKDWGSPKMIPIFKQNQLLKLISKKSPNEIYSGNNGIQISKLIWEPLLPYFQKNIKVYFSPTNLLYKIGIESLPLSDGKLISDKYEMIRLSSTRELCINDNNDSITTSALYGGLNYKLTDKQLISESRAYASKGKIQFRGEQFNLGTGISWQNLPQTKKEVEYIDSLFLKKDKFQHRLYTGNKGNEESFKDLSGKKISLIHIATHGFFLPIERAKQLPFFNIDDSQPIIENALDRSGLIFTGANDAWTGKKVPKGIEDGILTAKEITTLDFRNTNLIVLSACETGLGDVTSEGVFGLQRAFKKAGVKTIVMSLWRVDDNATKIFMSKFYYSLLNGKNKRQAFSDAQKSLRLNNKYNNPLYWAAFVMVD
jgi:hypothetical protein